MRVHVGTDHAGFELKEALKSHLQASGHEVVDHGAHVLDKEDDYPAFCIAAGLGVVEDQRAGTRALGVVIGGSGNGEQIAANKVPGVRAALVWNQRTATLAREHNDANVASVGAREHDEETALALIDAFLAEPFSGEARHSRRIDIVSEYETSHSAPAAQS
ncbi:ribose-5-phosphate isomerase [Spelaeicoccus albus]|uniref:Ribose-5-phosphate isomerase B n=1 Tax=Spelaeicoccus albus TaxID=1280376 RepID=A0A7Z0D4W2_9MICO|nr:ribose-5-phosphate isomerase [Spelaeicoccus albus]NYI68927.1 ribose 5-phosphate isomerase B [Spelaeicoccus albus]